MTLDALLHSQMDPARPSELQYDYERIYAEVLRRAHPPAEPIDAFFIGGGGYVFPRYVEETYPGSHVEVAEIDPVVTRAAFEAFRLPRDTSVRAFDMDARNRVAELVRARRSGEPVPAFDFVFGDAFHDLSVPWHLSTVEFCEDLAALMSDDGVYLLNLIDGYGYGRFLGAVIRTCRAVFPHVEVVAATPVLSERSTFVVVASKRPLDLTGIDDAIRERREFGGERLEADQIARLEALDGGMLLTDDHAPVENLLAEIATRRPRIDVPDVLARAIAAMEAGRRSEAQATLREALALAPTDPRLLNELGRVLAESGDTEGAREAFAGAVHWQPHVPRYRANLALALLDSGRPIEAATELEACLELDPQNAAAANTLARLRASAADERLRDGAEAVRWAEHLAELVGRDQPEVADTLALAYAAAGRFDEARGWVARASKLAETQGRPDLVDSIRAHAAAFAAGRAWIEPER
jgi:Flp pilus assembly protein TadD/spermidine synthase